MVVGSRRESRRPGRPHSRQDHHVLVPVEVRHQVLEALGVGHLVGKTAPAIFILGKRAAPQPPCPFGLDGGREKGGRAGRGEMGGGAAAGPGVWDAQYPLVLDPVRHHRLLQVR